MKHYLTLLKTLINVNFSFSALRHRWFREKHNRWQPLLIGIGVPLVAVPLYALIFMIIRFLHSLLRPIGQEYLTVTLVILLTQIMILMFGFFYFVSAFYFSRDSDLLLSLPLKPGTVLAAKFSIVLINEYLSTLPLMLPALVYFGILQKVTAGYWIQLIPVLVLAPVVPLSLAALLVLVLMRFVNLGKKKDLFIVIGSLALFIGVMYAQVMLGKNTSSLDQQAALRLLAAEDGLIRIMGERFPPSLWATRMLQHGFTAPGIRSLLLFCGLSLLLGIVLIWTGKRVYYRGLVGLREAAVFSGNHRGLLHFGGGRHPLRAIFSREWRVMNRTPIFLLNGALTVVMMPVVFTMMTKFGGQGGDSAQLFAFLFSTKPFVRELAMAGFLVLCAALNGTASSAFSREGGRFWISKTIPVSPRLQITGKFIHSGILALMGILSGTIALHFILRPSGKSFLTALLLGVPLIAACIAAGLLVDLIRPLLNWTNPIRAIKQNVNVVISMLIDIALLFFMALLWPHGLRAGLSPVLLYTIYCLFFTILFTILYALVLRLGERRYRTIET